MSLHHFTAMVSRRASPFEGGRRQARGFRIMIVDILLAQKSYLMSIKFTFFYLIGRPTLLTR